MSFYTDIRLIAQNLLKGKGQTITLTYQGSSSYNTSTGGATISTSTASVYGAVFEYGNKNFEYGNKNIDGTLIKVGDKQLLLSALNTAGTAITAPVVNDTVTINSVAYTITQVKTLSPAGTVVLYDCNIRGAV
jgi:hypothetical protein